MSSDYFKPETWISFSMDNCHQCHADCCRLPVDVTTADLIRMDVATSDEFETDLEATFIKLKKQGIIKQFDLENKFAILNHYADGRCLYLKNSRCRIYEKRPQACRDFPAIGARAHHCPYNKRI